MKKRKEREGGREIERRREGGEREIRRGELVGWGKSIIAT